MSRHIVQAADGSRHIVEVPDEPTQGSTLEQRAAVRAAFDKAEADKALAKDYSGWEGVKANVGAGMSNVVEGAKNLFGLGKDDAAIDEERKLKEQLANSTLGGGALQVGGELAASAPLGIGAGGIAAKGAAKLLPKATEWATRQGSRAFNLGTAGRAAVEGGAMGALAETKDDESRLLNTGLGATMGVAAPAVLGVAGKTAKVFRDKYAPERAAHLFQSQLGSKNVAHIQDAIDAPITNILPLSTAALSENVPLAALERGARGRSGANLDWGFDHDKKVAEAAWNQLQRATANADELPQRMADREAMMEASRKQLSKFKGQKNLTQASNDLSDFIETVRKTPAVRQNPELTNLMGQTEQMLLHPERTAGDYASQYWRLSTMLDDAKLPAENRAAIMKLRDAVGRAADTATGGQHFSDMLGRYMAEQQHVGEAAASKAIRESFLSPEGVVKTKDVFGTPEIAGSVLRKSMATKGENIYGSTIDQGTRSSLDKLEKELSRHELWRAGNAPGSTTLAEGASPVAALGSGANNPFNRIWALRGLSNVALGGSRKATVEAADAALQDPQVWKRMMEEYAKSKSPLSPQEYAARYRKQLMMMPGRIGTAQLGGE